MVFTPTPAAVRVSDGPRTTVHLGSLGAELEGAVRPTHFAGMLTVVLKLRRSSVRIVPLRREGLPAAGADPADGGRSQRRHPIVGVPTVREPDGLALSSRNVYLSPSNANRPARCPRRCWPALSAAARLPCWTPPVAVLDEVPAIDLDYLELRGGAGADAAGGVRRDSSSRAGWAAPGCWTTSPSTCRAASSCPSRPAPSPPSITRSVEELMLLAIDVRNTHTVVGLISGSGTFRHPLNICARAGVRCRW